MLPVLKTGSIWPNWIEEFFSDDYFNIDWPLKRSSIPSINVYETNDDYRIEVAAPGLKKEDFKIELDNNILKISSEHKTENEQKEKEKILRREFNFCSFKRVFTVPDTVEADKIKAKHENGILTITLPKKESGKVKPTRTIEIK